MPDPVPVATMLERGRLAREPAECLLLVAVGSETEGDVREEFGVRFGSPERQFERQPGALDQRVSRLDEVLDEAVERLRCRGEGRPQLVPQAVRTSRARIEGSIYAAFFWVCAWASKNAQARR